MIVPMKKVSVIVQTHDKSDMLKTLRKHGLMHIYTNNTKSKKGEQLLSELDLLNTARINIEDSCTDVKNVKQEMLDESDFMQLHSQISTKLEEKKLLKENLVKDALTIDRIKHWGDFNPQDIENLRREGIELNFYTLGKKELSSIDDSVEYIELDPVDKQIAIAVINQKLDPSFPAKLFELPSDSLSQMQLRVDVNSKKIADIDAYLASNYKYIDCYQHFIKRCEMEIHFDKVACSTQDDDSLVYITGYIPQTKLEKFEKVAKKKSWGYMSEDPGEDDNPPTLVQYQKGVGIIKPLFDILGTVPGYHEGDISLWFLMFFTLFFAMIIGDAGYGLIFLLAGVAMHLKTKKVTTANLLLYVLSAATIIWGSLTGTWFGSETILINTPLKNLVLPNITNFPTDFDLTSQTTQNNIMQFCFILGTIQLTLAEVINIVRKIGKKDISFIADIGWTMDIVVLYFVVLNLVIQAPCNYSVVFPIIIVGFVLVTLFGAQKPGQSFAKGITEGLGGIFTNFLDTISCFSNLMSYIRLFAVGLATLAIAQSFNSMAAPLMGGATTVVAIIILIIGHSLNLVMGLLSVIVHGVRLNLLEFSGQLGMEWSGIEYEPFKETVNENVK
ncbi:MAG: V-type ATPase 116kDa subunit family protein [Sphaerochaetaceae bacterium]|nr:ATPase [Sphaerochaetaceae bacterium]MDC7237914.1 V-type ATPase 116kDa subunit family protein [Sphaerochaetaceae bacterium]MDC7243077.1 V-type ATPase 116kDa subunit family protein [Sphaerochaetaceae bacterium]